MGRSWLRVIVVLAGGAVSSFSARAAAPALPIVPKMVMELYLPEEQEAAKAAHAVYAGQSEEARERLHRDGRLPLASGRLSAAKRGLFAAWFNSARWGCDPPAERPDAEAVAKSALVLTEEEGAVELALQSPEKKLWKTLTIACTPEKAEWVRDGVPLLPAWLRQGWDGGMYPPKLPGDPSNGLWLMVRGLYRAYAELDAARLRELHRGGLARIDFRSLNPRTQAALLGVVDTDRLSRNRSFGKPLDQGRPPAARRRHFGITTVIFEYRRTHPNCPYSLPFGTDMYTCPRPYKQVYLTLDASYPPPPKEGGRFDRWDPSPTYLVAMPAALQAMVVEWERACADWEARWRYKQGGREYEKPDAPPYPRFPLAR
jgi:hypothetical protein